MNRLTRQSLDRADSDIARAVNPADLPVGIVHFGPGAFHRAHQAAYIDALLRDDPRWGIAAVSMRSRTAIDALAAQDGLYTLAIRDAAPAFRFIDAHRRFLGPEDAAQTMALLADPAIRLVTATVTEKGYCLAPDGTLDRNHPDIVHDLAGTATPASLVGWLVAGLAARRAAGVAPFVPVPCDNIAANGAKLHAALIAFAGARDRDLADWIAGEVRVPSTMVDAITPASDDALYRDVAAHWGLGDRAAVQRESFAQWVIEDIGTPLGPDLAAAGVTLTSDVAGYEQAKLRILNAAHSTLAYAGLLRGATSVADAMADAPLARFVEAMLTDEVLPVLPAVPGLSLTDYRDAILTRFRNPGIVHRLDQIAQDGSAKLPQRLGPTLTAHRRTGRMPHQVVAALGCWVGWLVECARSATPPVDPAAATLVECVADGDPRAAVARLAGHNLGIPRSVLSDAPLLAALGDAAEAASQRRWDDIMAPTKTG